MTERKQTNPPFLTELPKTSISPVSQGFLARDSAFFSCENFELPILEKRLEKISFCFTFFSDLMIAMQEKKLIRIPLLLLPKTCKHRTQKHTIAPSRKPNCKFLLYRKKLLQERKELGKILMKRWKCLEMGEHYSVLLINGESIVKSSLIVKRKFTLAFSDKSPILTPSEFYPFLFTMETQQIKITLENAQTIALF